MHLLKTYAKFLKILQYRQLSNFVNLDISEPHKNICHVKLNRPKKRNSLDTLFFNEIKSCFQKINESHDINVVVLSGQGAMFCSGLDFEVMKNLFMANMDSNSKENFNKIHLDLRNKILEVQDVFTTIEKSKVPVIAVIHGGCLGAGMALAAVSDIRYCTPRSYFQIREPELGFPSDVGTVQRLHHLMGHSDAFVREIALTARRFSGLEAHRNGFALIAPQLLPADPKPEADPSKGASAGEEADLEATLAHCMGLAQRIAGLDPLAVRGTKCNLNQARPGVAKVLDYAATFNMAALRNPAIAKAIRSLFGSKVD